LPATIVSISVVVIAVYVSALARALTAPSQSETFCAVIPSRTVALS
jgi:hypothetical protein